VTGNSRALFQAAIRWPDFEASLELVPPLADGFAVYRGTERACQWALWHRYYLAKGIPACAHGLYLMNDCPAASGLDGCGGAGFDHTTVWVPADRPWEPFVLTQPYVSEIPAGLRAYAGAHGLAVSVNRELGDGWLNGPGGHELPVRLSVTDTGCTSWPLGTRAVVLAAAAAGNEWPDVQGPAWWQQGVPTAP
jgi:hypothetical protein